MSYESGLNTFLFLTSNVNIMISVLDKSFGNFLQMIESDKVRTTVVELVTEIYTHTGKLTELIGKYFIKPIESIIIDYVVGIKQCIKDYMSWMGINSKNLFKLSLVSARKKQLVLPLLLGQKCGIHDKYKCFKCAGVEWCLACGKYFSWNSKKKNSVCSLCQCSQRYRKRDQVF